MIPSNSGCDLIFTKNTVVKTGGVRLVQQMELQRAHDHSVVKSPRIIDSQWRGDTFGFEMERIHNETTIFKSPDVCFDKICNFVLDNLERSQYHNIPAKTFIDKLNDIDTGRWSWVIEDLKMWFSCAGSIRLPIGPMHGDLTFCNVLCQGEDVFLIDFLDGIVSSPVMDVAKMRQDSHHGWIELFDDAPDREAVDMRIMRTFGDYPWLREMTLLCLLRIDPYAKTEAVHNFLRREIPRAYSDLDGGR